MLAALLSKALPFVVCVGVFCQALCVYTDPLWIKHYTVSGCVTATNLRGAMKSSEALAEQARRLGQGVGNWPTILGTLQAAIPTKGLKSVGDAPKPPPKGPGHVTKADLLAAFGSLAQNFSVMFPGEFSDQPGGFVEAVMCCSHCVVWVPSVTHPTLQDFNFWVADKVDGSGRVVVKVIPTRSAESTKWKELFSFPANKLAVIPILAKKEDIIPGKSAFLMPWVETLASIIRTLELDTSSYSNCTKLRNGLNELVLVCWAM